MKKKTIHDYNVGGENVFVRADLNVPPGSGSDDKPGFRIRKSVSTIQQVIDNGGTAIVASHRGRPDGAPDPDLTMDDVAVALQNELGKNVQKLDDCVGDEVEEQIENADPKSVFLLENLRFHPGEEENDDTFVRKLAYLADIYINDSFGSSHRNHASITGIPNYVQKAGAGLLLNDEISYISDILDAPEEPFLLVLGGAKIADKTGMIKSLLPNLDRVLVGGAMSFPFLKAKGINSGDYELDSEVIDAAREIIEAAESEDVDIELPPDHLVTDNLENGTGVLRIVRNEIKSGWVGGDIGPDAIRSYKEDLKDAGSIFWNGPLGIVENDDFSFGTELIARHIASLEEPTRVSGGGETAEALDRYEVTDQFDHVSTGGGALLQFMENRTLPGIEALPDK